MNAQQRQALVEALVDAALAARRMAYAPYSNFLVGAAVLTEAGTIHAGCNIENASYGLTICAERVALGNAVAVGNGALAAMAVATTGGAAPCGACRQFAAEFRPDLPILLVDADHPERVLETNLAELLPSRFHLR
jgi:cytidine deaminase